VTTTTTTIKRGSKSARRRAALDESQIVSAAVTVIRRSGVPALSMRQLARELGITPMSIYHHIPNKQVLLDRVVDFILAPVPTPAPQREAWVAQMKAYTLASWEALTSCPGLSEAALNGSRTPGSQRLARHAVAILREAGFDEVMATLAVTTYHAYVFGLLSLEVRFERGARARKRTQRPTPAKASTNPLSRVTARAWMEFGIDTALAGLRHQLEHAPTSAAAHVFERTR